MCVGQKRFKVLLPGASEAVILVGTAFEGAGLTREHAFVELTLKFKSSNIRSASEGGDLRSVSKRLATDSVDQAYLVGENIASLLPPEQDM